MKLKILNLILIFFLVLNITLPQSINNLTEPKRLIEKLNSLASRNFILDSIDQHAHLNSQILLDSSKKKWDSSLSNLEEHISNNKEGLIDSTVTLYEDSSKYKTIFVYNSNNDLIEKLLLYWKDRKWEQQSRTLYTRESNYYLRIDENFDGIDWVPYSKYESKYNNEQQILFYGYYKWKDSWVLEHSEKNEYSPFGDVVFSERNYVGYSIYTIEYNYNDQNELTEQFTTELNEDGSEFKSKEEYQSNVDGFSKVTINYNWVNENWFPIFKEFRNYKDNKFTNSLSQNWMGDFWQNYHRSRVEYDGNDKQILYLSERWDGINWVNDAKRTKSYNINNDILETKEEWWLEGKWELLFKSTYNYDSKNNLINCIYLSRESKSNSFDIYKYEYDYDSNNNRVYISTSEILDGSETYNYINTLKYDFKNRSIINTYSQSFKGQSYYLVKTYRYYNDATVKLLRDDQIATNRFSLFQNYPNPFNPNTTISFIAPKSGIVTISMYNSLGQKIHTITEKWFPEGMNFVYFNSSRFSSGAYFYRHEADGYAETKKMIILK